jgi:hypothetical protein
LSSGLDRAIGDGLDLDRDRVVLLDDAGDERLDVLLELVGAGQRFRRVFNKLADVGRALVGGVLAI